MLKFALAALLSLVFTSAHAGFGFLKSERLTSTKRICVYGYIGHDNASGEIVYEFKPAHVCPAQIII